MGENVEVKYTSTVYYIRLPNGRKAYLKYSIEGDTLKIIETYTPPEFRGRGLAGKLVKVALERAEREGLKVEPICSYALHYFIKHPEYRHLLSDKYKDANLNEMLKRRLGREQSKSQG